MNERDVDSVKERERQVAVIPRGDHFVALAILRSLGRSGIDTLVIAGDSHALTFSSKYCHNKIVSRTPAEYIKTLTKNHLILPTDEGVMLELAKNPEKYRCTCAFPRYNVLGPLMDKRSVLLKAAALDISGPVTFTPSELDGDVNKIPFPVVVKPARSLGGLGISFVENPDDLALTIQRTEPLFGQVLIQEKIPYTRRFSVAILMNHDQEVRLSCVLEALRCNPAATGPACYVESVARPDLVNMGADLLASMRHTGVAELEFVIDSRTGAPCLMEINPRFWGSLQGAISAGVDFPRGLVELYTDGDTRTESQFHAGIRTRNVLVNDFQHLKKVLQGNDNTALKIKAFADFFRFYRDDAYYIFDPRDIGPFLSIFSHSFRVRWDRIREKRSVQLVEG